MIYFYPTTTMIDELSNNWGVIRTPLYYATMPHNRPWILDNGMFTEKTSINDLFAYMQKMDKYKSSCKFVVCPDVVCNCIATMDRYRQFAWQIKSLGWTVAFAAQDGQESYPLPPEYDAIFIGGSTEWKLSGAADYCIKQAQDKGKWTHVGRVNSKKRIRHFQLIGVDSVDGTNPIFSPDRNIPNLDRQLRQEPLFRLEV